MNFNKFKIRHLSKNRIFIYLIIISIVLFLLLIIIYSNYINSKNEAEVYKNQYEKIKKEKENIVEELRNQNLELAFNNKDLFEKIGKKKVDELRIIIEKQKLDSINFIKRTNWEYFIELDIESYEKEIFGGLSNIKLNLSNKADYMIDKAVIKIKYIKANNDIHHEKILTFENISGQQNISFNAPSSNRGVRIDVEIIELRSNEIQLCYDKDSYNIIDDETNDRWKCK